MFPTKKMWGAHVGPKVTVHQTTGEDQHQAIDLDQSQRMTWKPNKEFSTKEEEGALPPLTG